MIGQSHRVGAVHAGAGTECAGIHLRGHLLTQDPNALELIGHQSERGRVTLARLGLVAGDSAVQPADEQVRAAVAIEVTELGYVLPVGEDRLAFGVRQRIGSEHKVRGLPRARRRLISIVLDVAVWLLGQEVEIPILIHVGKAVPLAHVEIAVAGGAESKGGQPTRFSTPLEQRDLPGYLLHEEIEIAVSVGIYQLRPRRIEPAVEGEVE